MAGSSPRARGAPITPVIDRVRVGIIPACAGSTFSTAALPGHSRDHPRVRGEHCCTNALRLRAWGSSPRARGALNGIKGMVSKAGIIPACAGSTTRIWRTWTCAWDHPRVRGEHLLRTGQRGGLSGIIPACAGSTGQRGRHGVAHGDHPRVRGEHRPMQPSELAGWGSSPRARGALLGLLTGTERGGIIPACAGSTQSPPQRSLPAGDHPRVRGEHRCMASRRSISAGSSPRARGARL